MKKLVSVLLVLLMLTLPFALASCDSSAIKPPSSGTGSGTLDDLKDKIEEITAYKLYSDALKKTNDLDSYNAELKMNLTMKYTGLTLEMPMIYDTSVSGAKSDNPTIRSHQSIELMGQTIESDIYVENDVYYVSAMGVQMKMDKESAELEYDDSKEMIDSIVADLDSDILKGVEIKDENGDKTIDVKLSEEKFRQIFEDIADDVKDISGDGDINAESSVKFGNINLSVTIGADGYIHKYVISFVMDTEITDDGDVTTVSTACDITLTYKNPGEEIKVEAPDGYLDYPDAGDLDGIWDHTVL